MKKASSARPLSLTCAGSVVVVEKIALSARAVKSTNVIMAKMVALLFPIYLGRALVNVCQTAKNDVNHRLPMFLVRKNNTMTKSKLTVLRTSFFFHFAPVCVLQH